VAVVRPPNEIGGTTVLAEDLENLAVAFMLTHVMALDHDPVSR
jgi:hypothetical protein